MNRCSRLLTSLVKRPHVSPDRRVHARSFPQNLYSQIKKKDANEILHNPSLTFEEINKLLLLQAKHSLIIHLKHGKSLKNTRKIESFFSNIGELSYIAPLYASKDVFILQFENKDSVDFILNRGDDGAIDDHMVSINLGNAGDPPEQKIPFSGEKQSVEDLSDVLDQQKTMNDQITLVTKKILLPSSQLRLRYIVMHSLEKKLKTYLDKTIDVNPFGSSFAGLGLKGSDMDLSIVTQEYSKYAFSQKKEKYFEFDFAEMEERENLQENDLNLIENIQHILAKHMPSAKDLSIVPDAHVPLVKFNLPILNLSVDLIINNYMGVNFNHLLNWYVRYNPNVMKVILMVRKWADIRGLLGHGLTDSLTPFMLQSLVLGYLMRVNELPSPFKVGILKRDIFFLNRTPSKGRCRSTKSAEDILCDFFKYFSANSPTCARMNLRDGTIVFDTSKMMIVNPFEPKRNVASNCSLEKLNMLSEEIKKTHRILQFRRKKVKHRPWGLNAIFAKS